MNNSKCSPCALCGRASALFFAASRGLHNCLSKARTPEDRAALWPFTPAARQLSELVPSGSHVLLLQAEDDAPGVLLRRACRLHRSEDVPGPKDEIWKTISFVLIRPGADWTQKRLDETVTRVGESLMPLPHARLLIACPNVGGREPKIGAGAPAACECGTDVPAEAPAAASHDDDPWTITGLETCLEVMSLHVEHKYCLPGRRTPSRCPVSTMANCLRSCKAKALGGRFAGQYLYQVRPLRRKDA